MWVGWRLMLAPSTSPGRTRDMAGSLAAFSMSKVDTSNASLSLPSSRRIRRDSTFWRKASAALWPGLEMPATSMMLRIRSASWLAACSGRRPTAAEATTTEQTRHTATAMKIVFLPLSLGRARMDASGPPADFCSGADMAALPPSDVHLDDHVVDQWCEKVREQDREHDAFRECRVDAADHDR